MMLSVEEIADEATSEGGLNFFWTLEEIEPALFPARRSNISPIDPHNRVSYLSLSISHEDYLRIAAFQEELRF